MEINLALSLSRSTDHPLALSKEPQECVWADFVTLRLDMQQNEDR